LLQSCLPAESLRQTATVLEVIDAGKIRVRFEDGEEAIVRYLGIDPPPMGTAGALQAVAYNRQLADGQPVTLLQDITYQDADGALPRYVLAGDTFINATMLQQGYARHAAQPPDVACVALFRRMTQAAFENFSGLWGMGLGSALSATATIIPGENLQSPNYGRLFVPTPTRGSPTPRCDPAYPTICIPPPPPYLNCGDIPYRNFLVLWPDPHDLDGRVRNGIGCERPTATP
jgi:micrococcal nuclease